MNSFIGEHGVFRGGRNVGMVTVREEGLMTVISCDCEMISDGVFRLAAASNDEFVSIGVVAPDRGRLRLRKSYTKTALAALGMDSRASFYLVLPGETLSGLKAPENVSAHDDAAVNTSEGLGDSEQAKAAPVMKLTLGARDKQQEESPEQDVPETGNAAEEPAPPPEITHVNNVSAVPEVTPPAPPPEAPRVAKAAPPNLPERERPPEIPQAPERERLPDIPDKTENVFDETPGADDNAERAPRRDTGPWKPIRDPASLFTDSEIAGACKNARGALTAERDGFTMLAIPASGDEPFPMMPVFCFGTSETIGGAEYIIFKTKNGNLAV